MFKVFIEWLDNIFHRMGIWFAASWKTTVGFFAGVAAFFSALFGLFKVGIRVISSSIGLVINNIDLMINPDLDLSISTGVLRDFFEIGNTFFPLVELAGCAVVLYSIKLGCAMYGFIKSWIPTVSS